jgi:hypothetical protein
MRHRLPAALALVIVAAAAAPALAKDSTWLLCKGVADHGKGADADKTYFVANLLEHRASNGEDRVLMVSLIYGDRVSRGTIDKVETGKAGKLVTKAVDGKHAVIFTGTGTLDDAMASFTLAGTLDETYGDAKADRQPFAATLACEALDDQAIGH